MCRDIRVGIPCWPDRWTSHCYTIRLSKTTSSMEVNRLMWERHLALRGTLHHVNLAKSSHAVSCFHVKQYWHDKSGEDQTNNRITGGLFVGNIHFFCFWLTFGSIYSFIIYYVYVCVYIHTHLYIYTCIFLILYTVYNVHRHWTWLTKSFWHRIACCTVELWMRRNAIVLMRRWRCRFGMPFRLGFGSGRLTNRSCEKMTGVSLVGKSPSKSHWWGPSFKIDYRIPKSELRLDL